MSFPGTANTLEPSYTLGECSTTDAAELSTFFVKYTCAGHSCKSIGWLEKVDISGKI